MYYVRFRIQESKTYTEPARSGSTTLEPFSKYLFTYKISENCTAVPMIWNFLIVVFKYSKHLCYPESDLDQGSSKKFDSDSKISFQIQVQHTVKQVRQEKGKTVLHNTGSGS